MNLPNKLTMIRVVSIPVFVWVFFGPMSQGEGPEYANRGIWALLPLIIFVAASLTDMLDGMIARKHGLVTDFGALMDPLADKLLVMAAMVCLMAVGIISPVKVIVILGREFMVTSIRLVAAGKGSVISADKFGKAKTVSQMVWIAFGLLIYGVPNIPIPLGAIAGLGWLVVALTVLSGANYLVRNRYLLADA